MASKCHWYALKLTLKVVGTSDNMHRDVKNMRIIKLSFVSTAEYLSPLNLKCILYLIEYLYGAALVAVPLNSTINPIVYLVRNLSDTGLFFNQGFKQYQPAR